MILELVRLICQPTIVILIFVTILFLAFNLKELHKRITEQRSANRSLSFTTAITKLPFQCILVASRETEGAMRQGI